MVSNASLDTALKEAVTELNSLVDFIRAGASLFNEYGLHFGHGTDNATDESMALVLHVLHLEPGLAAELFHSRLTHSERERICGLLKRRIVERIPSAYLTGQAYFAGLQFKVTPDVLVPRSPLAEWIERGFDPWLDAPEVERIVDVGTGSGCIAIACALAFGNSEVDAVDISPAALAVARDNVEKFHLEDQVKLLQGDLLGPCQGTYDLIISNPPYVPTASFNALAEEFQHEPSMGLVAGDDGLDCVRQLLSSAGDYLSENGLLVVEVGEAQDAVMEAWPETPFEWLEFERGGDGVFVLQKGQLP
jgi:ribosomal protein L3 glutamine methyltransferase